ncbi:MAG: choice-of-anchor D domain-containing protein [Cytophagales bacterium]|nr:choice-of-anchor D domain-containing protein [Cytophagales bacterium]
MIPLFLVLLAGWLTTTPARAQFVYAGQIDRTDVGPAFTNPFSVAADARGNIYVSGSSDYIHKYDGTRWTILGDGTPGNGDFKGPRHVTIDRAGNLYVVDSQNNRIQKFDGKTWTSFGTPGTGNGQLMAPEDVVVDEKSGDIYIADVGNARVQKYNPATKTWTTLISPAMREGEYQHAPYSVALDSEGNLYVNVYLGTGRLPNWGVIEKFDGKTWTTLALGAGELGPFWGLGDLSFDEQDNLYVGDVFNNRVLKFDGTRWTAFGTFGKDNGQFSTVYGIAFDGTGRVYVTDWGNTRVQIFNQVVPAVIALREAGNKLASGGSHDFGQLSAGGTRTVTLTIHNRGGAPLELGGTPLVSVSGTHAGDFTADLSETAAVVAPKGTTTFKVTFKPAAVGTRTAQLAIASNDPATPVFSLSLTGTQTKPEPPVTPAPVVPGPVAGNPSGDTTPGGTDEEAPEATVAVAPNPATGKLRVTLPAHLGEAPLVLYNSVGKALLTQPGGGGTVRKLDVRHLPAGVYYLRVGSGPKRTTQRVLIRN